MSNLSEKSVEISNATDRLMHEGVEIAKMSPGRFFREIIIPNIVSENQVQEIYVHILGDLLKSMYSNKHSSLYATRRMK